jgi:stage II sporulation protein D
MSDIFPELLGTGISEPVISVGIMDRQESVAGRLNGDFGYGGFKGLVSGTFTARADSGEVVLVNEQGRELVRSPRVALIACDRSTFTLMNVTIGNRFHWERTENQTFQGNLVLKHRQDGTVTAINEIDLEDYLKSVISSEMSAEAPVEFLKAHAILSRSWLMRALNRKKEATRASTGPVKPIEKPGEVERWYEQEDHDLFDVCADDHCQRYQGITKIISGNAGDSVIETSGTVMVHEGEICDARYSKACGGLTEDFRTAWDNKPVPYLVSISDAPVHHAPVLTEEEATRWILSEPEAYCNVTDKKVLMKILPGFDQETKTFFRWEVDYSRSELEAILKEKSGIDFGTLEEIRPLDRGPSGRIFRLIISGSKQSIVVGKELEIRRWLSKSHLYSSAFTVTAEKNPEGKITRFIFRGAGWGHGVGLCQIGAAVMATRGFTASEILSHYFPGTEIRKVY